MYWKLVSYVIQLGDSGWRVEEQNAIWIFTGHPEKVFERLVIKRKMAQLIFMLT